MTTAPPEGTRPDDPEEEEEVYPPDFIYALLDFMEDVCRIEAHVWAAEQALRDARVIDERHLADGGLEVTLYYWAFVPLAVLVVIMTAILSPIGFPAGYLPNTIGLRYLGVLTLDGQKTPFMPAWPFVPVVALSVWPCTGDPEI